MNNNFFFPIISFARLLCSLVKHIEDTACMEAGVASRVHLWILLYLLYVFSCFTTLIILVDAPVVFPVKDMHVSDHY